MNIRPLATCSCVFACLLAFAAVCACAPEGAVFAQTVEGSSGSVGNPPLAAASPSMSVTMTAFRKDDGNGMPGAAVAQFLPSDHVQHFEVGVQAAPPDSLVRWDFQALESTVGPRDGIASIEQRLPIPLNAREVLLHGKVSLPRDWPMGRYRATVSLNGVPLRMLDYVVGAEPTPLPAPAKIKSFLMFSDDGRGKPGVQRNQFTPADHKIHFRADLTARLSGKVRWKFTAVTTAAGNGVSLLDLQGDVSEVDYLVSQMSAPRDWPVGVYRAEVFINDVQVQSFEFTISNA